MKYFVFVLLAVYGVVDINGDINVAREDGLKKIEENIQCILKVVNKTTSDLNYKPARMSKIYNLAISQADKVRKNNIDEIEDEVKLTYLRAEIMECQNNVYHCVASSANNGEVKIKNLYELFWRNTNSDYGVAEKAQTKDIDAWEKDVKQKEAVYRKKYSDATYDIFNAKNASAIPPIVTKFANETKTFEAAIMQIHTTLEKIQVDAILRLQATIQSLRTNIINAKNLVFTEIKACIPTKKFFLLE